MSDGKTDGTTRLMLRRRLAIESVCDSLGMNSPSVNGELDCFLQGKGTGSSKDNVMCTGTEV